jgi:hypothetical protein
MSMTFNVNIFVRALVVLFVVALACIGLGGYVAPLFHAPPITAIGAFFANWAWPIGLAAGAWYYFTRTGI